MDATTRVRLIAEYVERYTKRFVWGKDGVLREHDLNFRVFEEFDRCARDDPESCWLLVLGVLTATDDEYTLANLAAGPLEDLINRHGNEFIDRIEQEARVNAKFRELLCGVWDSAGPELAARLRAAREFEHDA
jgi:hypothetical protein